jgi:ribosomal protein L20
MPRVRKGAARAQARKKILRAARGYYGVKHKHKYQAENALIRAGVYRFRDRRRLKRDMRRLWVTRLTAACRMRGTRYSVFVNGLKMSGVLLNRKMLSQIAIEDPKLFDRICETAVKASRAQGGGGSAKVGAGTSSPLQTGILKHFQRQGHTSSRPNAAAAAFAGKAAATGAKGAGEGDIIDIEGIGPTYKAKLAKVGIAWIKELRERGRTKAQRTELAEKSGIKEALILDWVNMADLLRIKGMNPDHAELLHKSGVDTVLELSKRIPANLHAKMTETNAKTKVSPDVPSEKTVGDWVDQAKKLPAGVEH